MSQNTGVWDKGIQQINSAAAWTWTAIQTFSKSGTAVLISNGGLEITGATANGSHLYGGSSTSVAQTLTLVANDSTTPVTNDTISLKTTNHIVTQHLDLIYGYNASGAGCIIGLNQGSGDQFIVNTMGSSAFIIGDGGSNPSKVVTGFNTIDDGTTGAVTLVGHLNLTAGANKTVGQATLVAGTVTVSNTSVTASSLIFLTDATPGGTLGFLSVGTITASTSFVINSSNALDTSKVNWLIIN